MNQLGLEASFDEFATAPQRRWYSRPVPDQPKIRHGRKWAIASLVCALLALAVAPLVFALVGIAAGTVAVADGERWWGVAGVMASVGALIVSFYLVAGLAA